MRHVTGTIRHLHHLRISNVFVIDGGPGDVWIVDTGHWSERLTLLVELRRAGLRPSDLTGVLLTHRHSDHAGNAAFLQRRYGVRVYAHRADAEVLAGDAPRPRLPVREMVQEGDVLAGLLAAVENRFPAAGLVVDGALDEGDTIAGLEVHWVPGHTDGSVFYRHASANVLLSGDTLLAAHPPLTIRHGLAMPYPSYATDLARAHESIHAFHDKAVAYEHLLAGHGPPVIGRARERVLEMLERHPLAERDAVNDGRATGAT
jgi:glyoxylase-like metal-dependent hydrolase (beta-lactamase superfamily II)